MPYYSWFHGYGTKILPESRAQKFALLKKGKPLALASGEEFVNCTTLITEIKEEKTLPQYISFTGHGLEFELCKYGVESVTINGVKAYKLEHTFKGDFNLDLDADVPLFQSDSPLYSLDTSIF